jgi:hypothetical protein
MDNRIERKSHANDPHPHASPTNFYAPHAMAVPQNAILDVIELSAGVALIHGT